MRNSQKNDESNDELKSDSELETSNPSTFRKIISFIRSRINFIPGFDPKKLSLEDEAQLGMDAN